MQQRKIYLVFALVCSIFGTTFLAIRLGVTAGAPPFLFAGIRFTAAGAILALALLAGRRATLASLAALAPRAALLSLPYIVGNFGATFWAEQYIASGTAAQIDAAAPIASALLSVIFLKKRLSAGHVLGSLAGFAGVWLIVRGVGAVGAGSEAAAGAPGDPAMATLAGLVMLAGAISFAGAGVLYKRLFDDSVDSFSVNALNMFFGGIGLSVLAYATGQRAFPMTAATLLPLAYLIVVGSLVGHSANLWLVRKAGPVFTQSWSYVAPVIATVVGAIVLREKTGWHSLVGAALTLGGVWLISRAEGRARKA